MGYCISQVGGDFHIKEVNLKPAYKAVKEKMAGQAYHWQDADWMKGLRDLVAVLEDWGYSPEVDDDSGDITSLEFNREKLGDEVELFRVIAPFVEAGSYIEISGEDGAVWRWVFNGTTCEEKYADMSFEDEKTFALLIWELVPEDTELYAIPTEVAEEHKKFLEAAHGNYINGPGWQDKETKKLNEGLQFLNHALSEDDEGSDGFEKYQGLWRAYKLDTSKPLTDKTITTVYHSGFIL